MKVPQEMIARARSAREHAHAPYSGFAVGACIRGVGGGLFAGANVENVAAPEGICAEAAALAAMVTAGERRIVEVVVLAAGDGLCTPCGGCRQRLAEFAGPDLPVHVCGLEGPRRTFTLSQLLPAAFGEEAGGQ